MHFKNQNLCLTSVHFKQVLRHPPIDITYAGFDPRFWSIQKTGKPKYYQRTNGTTYHVGG